MRKRILLRIVSMEQEDSAKLLISIIKNIDEKFDPCILMDYRQGDFLGEIPLDIHVISLAKGRKEMSRNAILLFFQLVLRYFRLGLYYYFPVLLKKKIPRIPDIEAAMDSSSLRSLMKSPFSSSKKINFFLSDILHHSADYYMRAARMMCRCHMTIFGALHIKQAFEGNLEVSVPRSIYLHESSTEEAIRKKSSEEIPDFKMLFPKDKKSFISVGGLTFRSGYDALILAHVELLREGFDHRVLVIGSGREQHTLETMIREHRVEDSFLLLGDRENPYPYIRCADYYIQPSRDEYYPLLLNDILTLNKPLICTDSAGIEDMIGYWRSAYLIQFDIHELKMAMRILMKNKKLVNTMIQEQQQFKHRRYYRRQCQQINQLFLEL